MTTDPYNQERAMSEKDPTRYITVDEQWSAPPPSARRYPEIPYLPIVHRMSDLTGEPADETLARAVSDFLVAPPDPEAMRLVREALPVGAPGIDVDHVLAAMPATQDQAVTLRALNNLIGAGEVIRQFHDGQPATLYRPVPHLSRATAASIFPPSRVEPGVMVGTPQSGKTTWAGPEGVQWRAALSTAVHHALPVGAPGATAEQVLHRVGEDTGLVEVQDALRRLVVDGAAISSDAEGAMTYRRHGQDEQ